MIHLDTNTAIAVLTGRAPTARRRFDAALAHGSPLALSVIAFHELRHGAAASSRPAENLAKIEAFLAAGAVNVIPLTAEDAAEAASIRAALRAAGTPIGPYDLLIAAQARRADATLVTANVREFTRVPRLTIADWTVHEP